MVERGLHLLTVVELCFTIYLEQFAASPGAQLQEITRYFAGQAEVGNISRGRFKNLNISRAGPGRAMFENMKILRARLDRVGYANLKISRAGPGRNPRDMVFSRAELT